VHHFEDALLIFSSRTIDDISGDFIKTLGVCEEMSGEGIGQTFKEKALRSLMRIIAPLL
jgi:hypothetical protein